MGRIAIRIELGLRPERSAAACELHRDFEEYLELAVWCADERQGRGPQPDEPRAVARATWPAL